MSTDATTLLPRGLEPHGVDAALRLIDGLRPGLTMLILHPLHDTPEARALTPGWASRVSNYQAGLSQELREHLHRSGVRLLSYRALRGAMRNCNA